MKCKQIIIRALLKKYASTIHRKKKDAFCNASSNNLLSIFLRGLFIPAFLVSSEGRIEHRG